MIASLFAALVLLSARPAAAQDPYGRPNRPYPPPPPPGYTVAWYPANWYLGFGLVGTRIIDQQGGPEQIRSGGGVTLWAGLRINDRLALELGWLGSYHNPATYNTWYGTETDFLVLEGVTADARVFLNRSGNFDPYLQGGLGVYALGSESFGLDSVGTGFQLGGGFDYWLGTNVTFGLRILYRGIAMGPPEGGANDVFISAGLAEGSVALHF